MTAAARRGLKSSTRLVSTEENSVMLKIAVTLLIGIAATASTCWAASQQTVNPGPMPQNECDSVASMNVAYQLVDQYYGTTPFTVTSVIEALDRRTADPNSQYPLCNYTVALTGQNSQMYWTVVTVQFMGNQALLHLNSVYIPSTVSPYALTACQMDLAWAQYADAAYKAGESVDAAIAGVEAGEGLTAAGVDAIRRQYGYDAAQRTQRTNDPRSTSYEALTACYRKTTIDESSQQ